MFINKKKRRKIINNLIVTKAFVEVVGIYVGYFQGSL